MKEPADLDFTLELLSVEQPEEYKKEAWQMDAGEKAGEVPALRYYLYMTSKSKKKFPVLLLDHPTPLVVDVMKGILIVVCESTLREEGNRLYVQGRIEEAEEKYKTAIGMLEQLMLRYGNVGK